MFQDQWLFNDIEKFLRNYEFECILKYPSMGSFSCANDTLFIKKDVLNSKMNTILSTYNLLRWDNGVYY